MMNISNYMVWVFRQMYTVEEFQRDTGFNFEMRTPQESLYQVTSYGIRRGFSTPAKTRLNFAQSGKKARPKLEEVISS